MPIKWERTAIFDAKGQEWPGQRYVYRTSAARAEILGQIVKMGPWIVSRGKPNDLAIEDTAYFETEADAQHERFQWDLPHPQIYKTKLYLAESAAWERRRFDTLKDAKIWIEIEAEKWRRKIK